MHWYDRHMADDIKAMTAELARDPASLVFLKLGEALRTRGQIEAAARIAASGVVRHPDLASAHDLYARVLIDLGDFERAFHEWTVALELEPRHFAAHKGLGFLCHRWGDVDGAVEHLELALSANPSDASVVQALQRVREAVAPSDDAAAATAPPPPPPPTPPPQPAPREMVVEPTAEVPLEAIVEGIEAVPAEPPAPAGQDRTPWAGLEGGGGRGVLLVDRRGLLLRGELTGAEGREVGEEVAAYLAGAAHEAERTARLLGLGAWRSVLVEGGTGNLLLARPTSETVLLLVRDREMPQGRLTVLADRACRSARHWLGEQRP